jgi:hypothetical protein
MSAGAWSPDQRRKGYMFILAVFFCADTRCMKHSNVLRNPCFPNPTQGRIDDLFLYGLFWLIQYVPTIHAKFYYNILSFIL